MKNSIHQKNEVEPKAKFKSGKTRCNEAIRKPQDEKHSKRRHRETLGDTGGITQVGNRNELAKTSGSTQTKHTQC